MHANGIKRRPLLTQLVCASCLTLLCAITRADSWETAFAAQDLTVERRDYAGSPLDEIRGITRVQASLNSLMALLKDAKFNRQWVYRSGGARILAEQGYAQAYVYGVVDAPWPMLDRDTVVRFDFQQDEPSRVIRIDISNHPDYLPPAKGFVRVPDFGGFWLLTPAANGWVEVTYQVFGDPGGLLPVWIANRAAAISVRNTLRNLPLALTSYRDSHSPHVLEPRDQAVSQ